MDVFSHRRIQALTLCYNTDTRYVIRIPFRRYQPPLLRRPTPPHTALEGTPLPPRQEEWFRSTQSIEKQTCKDQHFQCERCEDMRSRIFFHHYWPQSTRRIP
jgi:hypothetical protein